VRNDPFFTFIFRVFFRYMPPLLVEPPRNLAPLVRLPLKQSASGLATTTRFPLRLTAIAEDQSVVMPGVVVQYDFPFGTVFACAAGAIAIADPPARRAVAVAIVNERVRVFIMSTFCLRIPTPLTDGRKPATVRVLVKIDTGTVTISQICCRPKVFDHSSG
jgi:hypothetical protein